MFCVALFVMLRRMLGLSCAQGVPPPFTGLVVPTLSGGRADYQVCDQNSLDFLEAKLRYCKQCRILCVPLSPQFDTGNLPHLSYVRESVPPLKC
jgi:hypothetical protein